ncbi:MAG: sigma-54-dependent Fis family transcriptional regulator [Bacteroidetes bacterium]|jgi:DNA-binding NtrC family response regulator|nr:sigma-54-dependent Fis family transcriptional regulator [Deltaproteobacteria bacterium]MBT7039601.1 sigma-54-dependent Fis family transcriptional regulator [Bacteroidota bacterium]
MVNQEVPLILIVDDNISNLRLFETILKKKGYKTAIAQNGQEALDYVEETIPDLILLDIMMPIIGGFETCQQLKASKATKDIPVIFITAVSDHPSLLKGFDLGGVDYITKPFLKAEVMARVDVHIGLKIANEKIQKTRDDLLSVLNQLRVGSIIIESDGSIAFISDSCSYIEGIKRKEALKKHWEEALPFVENSKVKLRRLINSPTEKKIGESLIIETLTKRKYWLEADVRVDPRSPDRSILYLYDVTEIYQLQERVHRKYFMEIVGNSEPMLKMYDIFDQVSKGDWTVLIEGETGVGKELVARSIHKASSRRNEPFIAINCAGLSETLLASQLFGHNRGAFTGAVSAQEGYFEAANNGTLFLDEIGDIPLTMQSSLLRVLQEQEIVRIGESTPRKVNVRILTATHRSLDDLVTQGTFREDLLYRIRVARILVPALRDRKEDIPMLVEAFLSESQHSNGTTKITVSSDVIRRLLEYHWPGNVRELKNVVEFCIIHCKKSVILPEDLPPELTKPKVPESDILEKISDESDRFHAALEMTKGNRTLAANLLNISRATFYRKLKQLRIDD